jgi:hypothetical protein
MPRCVVSFVDMDGFRHAVEVGAESLFEAGALAISAFRRHECEPAPVSKLDIEITSTVKHTVTPQRIRDWISGAARSPKDLVLRERLRKLVKGLYLTSILDLPRDCYTFSMYRFPSSA